MLSSVDLPEPDAPMIATSSPSRDGERDAAQGLDGALRAVEVVALADVAQLDHRTAPACPRSA